MFYFRERSDDIYTKIYMNVNVILFDALLNPESQNMHLTIIFECSAKNSLSIY